MEDTMTVKQVKKTLDRCDTVLTWVHIGTAPDLETKILVEVDKHDVQQGLAGGYEDDEVIYAYEDDDENLGWCLYIGK